MMISPGGFDRSIAQCTLPDELVDELVQEGLAERGGATEFRSGLDGQVLPVIVAVTGLAGSVVTLITQSHDALARLALGIARWRSRTEPNPGQNFSLMVMRDDRPVVSIRLDRAPDPDALLAFLQSALGPDASETGRAGR